MTSFDCFFRTIMKTKCYLFYCGFSNDSEQNIPQISRFNHLFILLVKLIDEHDDMYFMFKNVTKMFVCAAASLACFDLTFCFHFTVCGST